ncbi:MAG: bifunctional riboflavin kinase/FAD synthetase [Bacillota bacterium]|nr:bifunctional riboflavin kinase/FAD synthetase [Bacillota bacterium]
MEVYQSIKNISQPTAVALGLFDGIHLGHQAVVSAAVEKKCDGLIPTVLTFSQNPKEIITGKQIPRILSKSDQEKIFSEMGVELFFRLSFPEFQNMSGEDFVKTVLFESLNAKKVFCGFNYHFGHGGKQNAHDLKKLCSAYGIEAITIPKVTCDGEVVSSSRIRSLIMKGAVSTANHLLGGRCFSFTAEVITGNRLGRTLGTPTINQRFEDGFILPKFGVYASVLNLDGKYYVGVTNIGMKPTVGSTIPLAETWIPDFNGDLYGKIITVKLVTFIRSEKKFKNIEDLKRAIYKDAEKAKKLLKI